MSKRKETLSDYLFIFAHGAGADKDSEWMLKVDGLLKEQGLDVIRFNFPYMVKRSEDGKRRPPDRQPKLIEAFRSQLAQLSRDQKIIVGGKSMGGRMASLLAIEEALEYEIAGVVCFGFPFHPPGKPDKYRGDHLANIETPTLILQGERDTFGTREEVEQYCLGENVTLGFIPDGDHSFKPRVRSGHTLDSNLVLTAQKVSKFVDSL